MNKISSDNDFLNQVFVERAAEPVPAGLFEDGAAADGDAAGRQEQGRPGTEKEF